MNTLPANLIVVPFIGRFHESIEALTSGRESFATAGSVVDVASTDLMISQVYNMMRESCMCVCECVYAKPVCLYVQRMCPHIRSLIDASVLSV